ncbi:MAG TPA: AmmeMemoRadiSam system radical SAM enzyme [Candidatus Hydrogenedentes bacterium]|nr:AmmeMemoRadiSam system radical SAM enzyme [Candidatus Hydrogenedentota bacterium]HOL78099.1 AmmeMemoRadiSam system radical SAM enzyme [Candidatus Hydrogenedentota bacterium]HPO86466.1 AmmeMemoRadiSam system radical SAM enzyme [Candidatus Hydrogenedentota bacterium]
MSSKRIQDFLHNHTMPAAPELVVRVDDDTVRCLACGNRCFIPNGESGICRMRFNHNGELRVPGGYVAGLQIDPIEKKPFFHAFPGREALSFGMVGCNLHCSFCQNWVSSQTLKDDFAGVMPHPVTADDLIAAALSEKAPVIVSTYNEPLITSDWAVEIFKRAKPKGLVCGYVSNGNATPEVLKFLRPYVDLFKVDLKCFDEAKYRELGANLHNILKSIELLKDLGFWVEIVTLVVPEFNNSPEELAAIAKFIASISPDIPWHVTAFHPDYKMNNVRRTSREDLDRAYDAGKTAGLHFVYEGNLAAGDRENTYCPSCGSLLIRRRGFYVLENRMRGKHCPECNALIAGMWEENPPKQSGGIGIPRVLGI